MMAVCTVICLIVIFLPLSKQNDIDIAIQSVLSAVESLVNYYTNNYKNLNIDGLYGLRVLEGHFEAIINGSSNGRYKHLTTETLQRLTQMKNEATRICSVAIEHVKNDDPGYYQIMNFVIGRPWEIFHTKQRKVDGRLKWEPPVYKQAQSEAKLDERSSDECMAELTGAMAKDKKKCSISSKCLGLMTYPGMMGYGLTHQILWTMLAEKAGCFEVLDQMLRQYNSSIALMQQELCSNNYIQMTEAVKKLKGKIIPRFQDLFLEQLFICPSIGFYEFLDLKFLPQILSWQKKSGCFGIMHKLSKEELTKLDLSDLAGTKANDYDYLDDKHSVSDNGGMVANNHPLRFENMHQDVVNFKVDPQNQVQHGLSPAVSLNTMTNFVNHQMNQFKNLKKQDGVEHGLRKLLSLESFDSSFDDSLDGLVHQNRHLLAEKNLGGGCLSHKTAVAAGALVIYLRHLLDPDAVQTFSQSGSHNEGLPSDRLQSLHRNLKKFHKTFKKSSNAPMHKDANYQLQGDDYRNNQVQPPDLNHEGKNGNDVNIQMPRSSHKLGPIPFDVPDHNLHDEGGMDQNEDKFGDINIPHKMIHYQNGGGDKDGNNNAGNGGDNYYDGDEEHATYNEEDDGDYNEDDNAEDNTYKDDVAGDNRIDQNLPNHARHVGNKKIDNHSFHNDKKMEVKDEDGYGNDDNADKDDNYYDDHEENMEHKKGDNSHNHKNSVHNVVAQHFKEEIKLVDVSQDSPSFKMLGFVFLLCLTGLLLLMYRFIKKRKIHIRYSPRTTYRV
ncbi:hypothetical protein ACJMK2_037622 [Sinanodonta woodiana]|uniref:Uncharacterized protein n=1 Tax=Sinanodonta woodiana TaxID=1069815 RepID=A0ABD3WN46_SINWO